ncbi:MAG: serine/threonine protein kinase [Deltaproteobacteria bacterium]|nr:serine/threonine protein kinase [Deltaproteobacteria bacterium]
MPTTGEPRVEKRVPEPSQPMAFGKYHLLEKIATGGMAEVYRARSHGVEGFQKTLVVKRILDSLARDEEFIQLFTYEAHIAHLLHHANIVQVFEFEQAHGAYYIAMEYVHGLDLSRILARARRMGPVPVALALRVACEVLEALRYAHEKTGEEGQPLHIVHCDVSPQNILVSFAGEVKITDFGISRAAMQARGTHKVVRGKYAYMSPEQVEGRDLDASSDQFSLGIVLFELLTGRRLFKARTRDETLHRVRRAEVPGIRAIRPEVSEDLEAIVRRSLARRPKDRFPTTAEMLDALSVLMVREGHRATHGDLARYVREVLERSDRPEEKDREPLLGGPTLPPGALVVLAAEAHMPPRSIAAPRSTLPSLLATWRAVVEDAEGQIWEHGERSLLVVWLATEGLREPILQAVTTALEFGRIAVEEGYRISAGVSPGVARLRSDTRRPEEGWELAGPFYLARWLMNLSGHRGRVLVTGVGRQQLSLATTHLGRVPIEGNRYIHVYEVASGA